MKKRIVVPILVGGAIAMAAAASLQPLNVKTGLWQMTEITTWTGLPPQLDSEMASGKTHSYRTCVKTEDLSTNPWAEGSRQTCKWTVLTSTGTDMEVRGTSCDMGSEFGMTAEVHGKIRVLDSRDGTGSFDITLTGNGQTISGHATYTGKWVGSSCGAE